MQASGTDLERVDQLIELIVEKGDIGTCLSDLCAFVTNPKYWVKARLTIGLLKIAEHDHLTPFNIDLVLEALSQLLKDKHPGVQGNAATVLAYIAIEKPDFIKTVKQREVIAALCDLSVSSSLPTVKEEVQNNIVAFLEMNQRELRPILAYACKIKAVALVEEIRSLAIRYGKLNIVVGSVHPLSGYDHRVDSDSDLDLASVGACC